MTKRSPHSVKAVSAPAAPGNANWPYEAPEGVGDNGADAELRSCRAMLIRAQALNRATAAQLKVLRCENTALAARVHELVQLEAGARRFAFHDELTGLANRRLLRDRFTQAAARSARERQQVVVLLLDLDDFKSINDRLGHAAGDEVLCLVASRLDAAVRATDTACRYGGDEFVLMLPAVTDESTAAAVEAKLAEVLDTPFIVAGVRVCMHVSLGRAVFPRDGDDIDSLLEVADRRMYRAKVERGRPVTIETARAPLRAAGACHDTAPYIAMPARGPRGSGR